MKFTLGEKEERELHEAFEIGIFLKGFDGIIELIGAFFLFFLSNQTIQDIFLYFARGELAEDPRDALINRILHFAQGFSIETQLFYAWLFLIHGAVKVFLVAGLVRDKLWAYPAAIAAFSLFVLYQAYQVATDYSLLLFLITIIDVIVIALTIHEYHEVRIKNAR